MVAIQKDMDSQESGMVIELETCHGCGKYRAQWTSGPVDLCDPCYKVFLELLETRENVGDVADELWKRWSGQKE